MRMVAIKAMLWCLVSQACAVQLLSGSTNRALLDELPTQWRHIHLQMTDPRLDDQVINIELLRPQSWIDNVGAQPGQAVPLSMAEMNVSGWATVIRVDHAPTIRPGGGHLITGTFRSVAQSICALSISGLASPLMTTAEHRFYSVDRDDWVAAGAIRFGEHLRAGNGTTVMSHQTRLPGPTPVFNLEVNVDHTYYVTDQHILVHNSYGNLLDEFERIMPGSRGWFDGLPVESLERMGAQAMSANAPLNSPQARRMALLQFLAEARQHDLGLSQSTLEHLVRQAVVGRALPTLNHNTVHWLRIASYEASGSVVDMIRSGYRLNADATPHSLGSILNIVDDNLRRGMSPQDIARARNMTVFDVDSHLEGARKLFRAAQGPAL